MLRLGLQEKDRPAFAAMNADARVMEFFPACLSPAESDAMAAAIEERFREHGYSFWAVEAVGIANFTGIAGLLVPRFEAHFTPCVEIGWRFAHEFWGRGYASEAARALLEFGFDRAGLDEIVSLTVSANERSRRVMERIGMAHDASADFDHPNLTEGDPLRRHVLYRLSKVDWASSR